MKKQTIHRPFLPNQVRTDIGGGSDERTFFTETEFRDGFTRGCSHGFDTLLADQKRLLRMQQAVKRMARPDAAFEVVSIVLKAKT